MFARTERNNGLALALVKSTDEVKTLTKTESNKKSDGTLKQETSI